MRDRRDRVLVSRRLVAAVVLLGTTVACSPAGPPNLVVITLDTARADRFGFHGGKDGLTQHVDRLAAESTVFADCIAPMGTTIPSHATLFTGLRVRTHGVRTNTAVLRDEISTAAEILGGHGYETGAFVSMTTLLSHGGLHQGFDVTSDGSGGKYHTRKGTETTELARPWLEQMSESEVPFFVWLHYFEPHSPYRMSEYAKKKLPGYSGRFVDGIESNRFNMGGWLLSPGDSAAIVSFYDGQMLEGDARLGELFALLRSLDLLSNTVVVLTSDHGQALGEHDFPGHGPAIWQSVVHVPLVIWDSRDRTARRVEERVGLIDLTPTLLELAGVPVPANMEGRSLLPALSGRPLTDRVYVAEIRPNVVKHDYYYRYPPYGLAVYEGRFKLMRGRIGTDLFDLEVDPGETTPLGQEDAPEVYDRLVEKLQRYQSQTLIDAPAEDLPKELVEALRALGYAL